MEQQMQTIFLKKVVPSLFFNPKDGSFLMAQEDLEVGLEGLRRQENLISQNLQIKCSLKMIELWSSFLS